MNNNPEVILLAAGCSRRLASLTNSVPKSFLEVAGSRIIERNLDALDTLGLHDVTIVVGYKRETFLREIGTSYKRLSIRYVTSPDYATTGHGWSLFRVRDVWDRSRSILLVHADIVYDPRILAGTLASPLATAITVDDQFKVNTNDEVLACGLPTRIDRIQKIAEKPVNVLGEVVGINKWSVDFAAALFEFMPHLFAKRGRNLNWEPVVDAFIREEGARVQPIQTNGLPWVNINYEADLARAERLFAERI